MVRSRFHYLGEGKNVPWSTLPKAGVQEIWSVLHKAIDAAASYIYVEDQNFGDLGTQARTTLFPRIVAAANRGVHVLFLSGVPDPADGSRTRH